VANGTGGEVIARILQAEGVEVVFGIIDGTYFGFYSALHRHGISALWGSPAKVKRCKPVELVIYEKEGHGNYLMKNRLDFANRLLAFLDRNIGSGSQAK